MNVMTLHLKDKKVGSLKNDLGYLKDFLEESMGMVKVA